MTTRPKRGGRGAPGAPSPASPAPTTDQTPEQAAIRRKLVHLLAVGTVRAVGQPKDAGTDRQGGFDG